MASTPVARMRRIRGEAPPPTDSDNAAWAHAAATQLAQEELPANMADITWEAAKRDVAGVMEAVLRRGVVLADAMEPRLVSVPRGGGSVSLEPRTVTEAVIAYGSLQTLRLLLHTDGALPPVTDLQQWTPWLVYAAACDRVEVLHLFQSEGVDVEAALRIVPHFQIKIDLHPIRHPAIAAVWFAAHRVLRAWSVKALTWHTTTENLEVLTAMHIWAVSPCPNNATLAVLQDMGLDVNGEAAWTPMHLAIITHNCNAAKQLRAAGGDCGGMDGSGQGTLPAGSGLVEAHQVLPRDPRFRTPAMYGRQRDMVVLLHEWGWLRATEPSIIDVLGSAIKHFNVPLAQALRDVLGDKLVYAVRANYTSQCSGIQDRDTDEDDDVDIGGEPRDGKNVIQEIYRPMYEAVLHGNLEALQWLNVNGLLCVCPTPFQWRGRLAYCLSLVDTMGRWWPRQGSTLLLGGENHAGEAMEWLVEVVATTVPNPADRTKMLMPAASNNQMLVEAIRNACVPFLRLFTTGPWASSALRRAWQDILTTAFQNNNLSMANVVDTGDVELVSCVRALLGALSFRDIFLRPHAYPHVFGAIESGHDDLLRALDSWGLLRTTIDPEMSLKRQRLEIAWCALKLASSDTLRVLAEAGIDFEACDPSSQRTLLQRCLEALADTTDILDRWLNVVGRLRVDTDDARDKARRNAAVEGVTTLFKGDRRRLEWNLWVCACARSFMPHAIATHICRLAGVQEPQKAKSCAVCMAEHHDIALLPRCGHHAFCGGCMRQWLQGASQGCPICRAPVVWWLHLSPTTPASASTGHGCSFEVTMEVVPAHSYDAGDGSDDDEGMELLIAEEEELGAWQLGNT